MAEHQIAPPLNYTRPLWALKNDSEFPPYSLECVKDGKVVAEYTLDLSQPIIVGRLPVCTIALEHASISRYHAVLEYNTDRQGVFICDLGSAHGTFVNKYRMLGDNSNPVSTASKWRRLWIGDILRFGASTRVFSLVTTDRELELKEREEQEHAMLPSHARLEKDSSTDSLIEVTWGMSEEADISSDVIHSQVKKDFVSKESAYYRRDPIKALLDWFLLKGFDEPEYEFELSGTGETRMHTYRVKLPISDETLDEVIASASAVKKKETQVMTALNACIELDSRGLLLNNQSRAHGKRKSKADLDEGDSFYDRVGDTKKSTQRKVETAATLTARRTELLADQTRIENELSVANSDLANAASTEDDEDLDAYMNSLQSNLVTETKAKLNAELATVKKELEQVQKLLTFAGEEWLQPSVPETNTRLVEPKHIVKKDQIIPKVAVKKEESIVKHQPKIKTAEPEPESMKQRKKPWLDPVDEKIAADDEEEVAWVPPKNQKGDGMTSLNAKYGY